MAFGGSKGVVDRDYWVNIANAETQKAQERILSHPEWQGNGSKTVLCLDISGSMEGKPFLEMIDTAKAFINGISSVARDIQIEENIALVTFGHETRFVRDLSQMYRRLIDDLDCLYPEGPSPLVAGLTFALSSILASPIVHALRNYKLPPRIIVMTDGLATPGTIISGEDNQYVELEERIEMDLMSIIMNLWRREVEVYCIPFGKSKLKYLQIMANRTNGAIIPPNEISRLVFMYLNYNAALNVRKLHCIPGEDWKSIAKEHMRSKLSDKDYERVFEVADKAISGSKSEENEDTLYVEFNERMPPIGKRVRRGPDWRFANQDANGPGTVIGHVRGGGLWVIWDHGIHNKYPFNNRDGYSVVVVDEPRKHTPGQSIMVGMIVTRGADWKSGNDDGGPGNIGTVFRTDKEIAWVVWENGCKGNYRFGKEDCYDIKICDGDMYGMTSEKSIPFEETDSTSDDIERDAEVFYNIADNTVQTEHHTHRTTERYQPNIRSQQQVEETSETKLKTVAQSDRPNSNRMGNFSTQCIDNKVEETSETQLKTVAQSDRPDSNRMGNFSTQCIVNEPTVNLQDSNEETDPKTIHSTYHDWQYYKYNEWQSLPKEVSDKLEKSFNLKRKTDLIQHDEIRYRVLFEKKPMIMRECTRKSGHEYQIQRKEMAIKIPREVLIMEENLIELYKTSLKNGKEKVYHIRVIVVGPEGVGKTVLTKRLLKLPVEIGVRESTNGIDVHVRKCGTTIPDGKWLFDKDTLEKANRPEARIVNVMKQKSQPPSTENTKAKEIVCDSLTVSPQNAPEQTKNSSMTMNILIQGEPSSLSFNSLISDSNTPVKSINDTETMQNQQLYSCRSDITEPKKVEDGNDTSILRLVRETYESTSSDKNTSVGEISFWDFGGQIVFYSTHQTFLTPRAVYLVVIDISKALKCHVPRKCYTDKDGEKMWNYEDYLLFWIKSIKTYGTKEGRVIPPVIIVATHVDKLTGNKEEQIQRFRCDLRRVLKAHSVLLMLDNIIEMDNTIDDPNLEQLRKEIFEVSSKQNHWGEEKPASWIMLEKKIKEQKIFDKKILSFSGIKELNGTTDYPIQNSDELQMFLSFHHAIGNVVYFNEDVLRDYIILDPQWLIDAFKLIITSEEFLIKDSTIMEQWDELNNFGILRPSLIDFVWVHDDKNCFHEYKGHIVNIMLRLDIIAKPIQCKSNDVLGMDYFFVPSMLKEKLTRNELASLTKGSRSTPYLCHVFENDFLPSAVFHGLLAACMGKFIVSKKGKKSLLYCGCGMFDVTEDENNRLLVCKQNNVIQMKVYRFGFDQSLPDVKLCVDIRKFIEEKLKSILDRTQQQILSKVKIRCKIGSFLTLEGLLDIEKLKKHSQVTCHEHAFNPSHSVSSYQLLQCWYGDQIYEMPHLRPISDESMQDNFRFEEYDRCPTERELNRLARKIGSKYKDLGRELGVKNSCIVNIAADNPSDVCNQCFEVLRTWKEQFTNNATLNNLERAMSKVDINTNILDEAIELEQEDMSSTF